ncbi:hypothetical protein TEA_013171 [Camellia sinensis var. sinensis]|uniref:Nucleotide-diphospho-sugar transferase domain-containing protein n=1 Tax=Camellia sinensis var. sinensis TaxID=542762 RepID=A0A4S4F1Q2_CAMSN|nr:hypothetical protein TEA_013171 [Camellia sinensis var. sinensis]
MGWRNQFQEIANSKPLFLTIYATVIIGILFSSFYVFSAVYSSSSSPSWFPQVSSHVESPPRDQLPNSSQLTTVGVVLSPAPQSQNKLRKPIWEVPPSGSKMPPLKTFRLTKGLVQKRVKDNIIIMTFGNYAFMDFILTWVKHLTDLGLDNILVGAMDTKLLEALYWKGIPVFDMGSHMSTTDVGWGSATFHKMGREKVVLIDTILPFGFELLMCDTDMVWLKNPLPYLARFPEADVLTSSDQVSPTVADDRLDIWKEAAILNDTRGFSFKEMQVSLKTNMGIWITYGVRDQTARSARRGPASSAPWQVWGSTQAGSRGSAPEAKCKNAFEVACPLELPFVRSSEDRLRSEVNLTRHPISPLNPIAPLHYPSTMITRLSISAKSISRKALLRGIRDSMHGSKPVEMENWVEMLGPGRPCIFSSMICSYHYWCSLICVLELYAFLRILVNCELIFQLIDQFNNKILLSPWTVGAAYNIGIFHWRPSDATKKLANEWKDMLLADDKIWDQNGFNELVRRQLGPSVDEDSELAYAYDGKLKLGVLPASIFCSGHTYFVQAMYQQLRLEPYAVHTTFQYAGTEGKRHRLREAMIFYDPPEFYDSPGGFLTFKPSIPKSLLLDGEHTIESHFSLINYQMKQIRTALSIASLLNRTLVMPPLWCRLDRLWFPHPGVLIGTMTRQPFLCPLDHVFEVNVMLKEMPADEFGPGINLREYSFFDNPSVPRQVKESWLDVQLCQEGSQNCNVSNSTSPTGVLKFPKNGNDETFKTVFSSFKDVKVIQFSSMQDAFLGFTDKASFSLPHLTREEKFRNRVKRYVGIWCCVQNHTPGHIYYDMYWDEKPDWKPIPPQKPEDDHPPWQNLEYDVWIRRELVLVIEGILKMQIEKWKQIIREVRSKIIF